MDILAIMDRLQAEWELLAEAPVIFGAVFLVLLLFAFVLARVWFSTQISNLQSRVNLHKEEAAAYCQRLDVDSPAEAYSKVNSLIEEVSALQAKVSELSVRPKRHLCDTQKAELGQLIRPYVRDGWRLAVIPFQDEECIDFAADLVDALKLSGIDAEIDSFMSGGPPPRKRDLELSLTLVATEDFAVGTQAAIKKVTGVHCDVVHGEQPSIRNHVGTLLVNRPSTNP